MPNWDSRGASRVVVVERRPENGLPIARVFPCATAAPAVLCATATSASIGILIAITTAESTCRIAISILLQPDPPLLDFAARGRLFGDAVQEFVAAQVDFVVDERRRCHEAVVERVGRQHLELRTVPNHQDVPV